MSRPTLASFDDAFNGDAVAELIYDTLVDRRLEPSVAAAKMTAHYDYEPFGQIVDRIEDGES